MILSLCQYLNDLCYIKMSNKFKSLLGIFPAACGVIWRNEQIYT
ncbi:hypothetical protein [Rickettsia endosymbiont of Gonocerus acuteangulatus]